MRYALQHHIAKAAVRPTINGRVIHRLRVEDAFMTGLGIVLLGERRDRMPTCGGTASPLSGWWLLWCGCLTIR
jgi:hypothetical protein